MADPVVALVADHAGFELRNARNDGATAEQLIGALVERRGRARAVLGPSEQRAPMIIVLVANTKGGCGKTTVSTHLAAALAGAGHRTALADADRQRSSLEWTRLRPGTAAPIAGLDWSKDLAKPPKDLDRLVIDAPAAMRKKDVFELVRMADVIVVPVLPSVFDQGSTVAFLARLAEMKSIRKNRKPVGVLRNRVRPRTRATAHLARFLTGIEHANLGALRDRAIYNDVAAEGLSIFDLPGRRAAGLQQDWAPLLGYVGGIG